MNGTPPISRRVLVIAHYFPPETSSGTLSTVKFAKFLPMSQGEPFNLTVRAEVHNGNRIDASLLTEIDNGLPVFRTVVWMPDRALARLRKSVLGVGSNRMVPGHAPPTSGNPLPRVRKELGNRFATHSSFLTHMAARASRFALPRTWKPASSGWLISAIPECVSVRVRSICHESIA